MENSIDEGMLAIADEKLKLEENLSSSSGGSRSGMKSSEDVDGANEETEVRDNEDSNGSVVNAPSADVASLLSSILDL